MPLGFKNGTDGNLTVAINAIKAASQTQTFLGIDNQGQANALTTNGNPHCHIVLRGGSNGPNYSESHVAQASEKLLQAGLKPAIMTDCSHANSAKDPNLQPQVFAEVVKQKLSNPHIIGAMVESNIHFGSQKFPQAIENLQYGVSITDGCIDWDTSATMIRSAHKQLATLF